MGPGGLLRAGYGRRAGGQQHGRLSAYRIWRFIQVNHGLDSQGALIETSGQGA